MGTATLGATTVQEDDVGFVTVLPGAENATWFKVHHFWEQLLPTSHLWYECLNERVFLHLLFHDMHNDLLIIVFIIIFSKNYFHLSNGHLGADSIL